MNWEHLAPVRVVRGKIPSMRRTALQAAWSFVMIATGMFGSGREALGATGEEHMLMLHNAHSIPLTSMLNGRKGMLSTIKNLKILTFLI